LAERGLMGFVEPLGFEICSLRHKSEAVDAIEALGLSHQFKLVHDTFHHTLAGGGALFPHQTGLVHISGVSDPAISIAEMRDSHRVLIDGADRIGNVAQIAALLDAGVNVPMSFEPFAADVHDLPDLAGAVRRSMEFIKSQLTKAAA
jgi:2-keto-myo-inositol isomerase